MTFQEVENAYFTRYEEITNIQSNSSITHAQKNLRICDINQKYTFKNPLLIDDRLTVKDVVSCYGGLCL